MWMWVDSWVGVGRGEAIGITLFDLVSVAIALAVCHEVSRLFHEGKLQITARFARNPSYE